MTSNQQQQQQQEQQQLPTLLVPGSMTINGKELTTNNTNTPVKEFIVDITHRFPKENFFMLEAKTGSGKSSTLMIELFRNATQGAVINLQPRVASANGLFNELNANTTFAAELLAGSTLGINTGFKKINAKGGKSLEYHSYGSIVQRIAALSLEEVFENVSVLVLDEVHDDQLDIMILMYILRNNTHLKLPLIICTSATFDFHNLIEYFSNNINNNTNRINKPCKDYWQVQGKQYDKYTFWLVDDKVSGGNSGGISSLHEHVIDLVLGIVELDAEHETIKKYYKTDEDDLDKIENVWSDMKDILIFVESAAEINKFLALKDRLPENVEMLPLNRQRIQSNDESYQKISDTAYPIDKTRLIVATNVVEVGITLERLGTVINLGWEKNLVHASSSKTVLIKEPISKDSLIQKTGRVGRLAPGVVFNVFSKKVGQNLPPYKPSFLERGDPSNIILVKLLNDSLSSEGGGEGENVIVVNKKETWKDVLNTSFNRKISPEAGKVIKHNLVSFNLIQSDAKHALTELGSSIAKRMLVHYQRVTISDVIFMLTAKYISRNVLYPLAVSIVAYTSCVPYDRKNERHTMINIPTLLEEDTQNFFNKIAVSDFNMLNTPDVNKLDKKETYNNNIELFNKQFVDICSTETALYEISTDDYMNAFNEDDIPSYRKVLLGIMKLVYGESKSTFNSGPVWPVGT